MEKSLVTQVANPMMDADPRSEIPASLNESSAMAVPGLDSNEEGCEEVEDESRHEAIERENSDIPSASNDDSVSQPASLETINGGLEIELNIGLGENSILENDIALQGPQDSLITSTITTLPNPSPSKTLQTSIEA